MKGTRSMTAQQQQSRRRNLFSCPITLDHDNFIGDNNAVCAKLLPRSVPLSTMQKYEMVEGKKEGPPSPSSYRHYCIDFSKNCKALFTFLMLKKIP